MCKVSLMAEVALNYVELRSYQARLSIAQKSLATQTETWQIASWRHGAGLTTQLDEDSPGLIWNRPVPSFPTCRPGWSSPKTGSPYC